MLGIIGAMESEIRLLLGKMQEVQQKNYGRMAFYLGKIEGQDIVLMESGIGKVAAAIGAQVMIDRFGVSGLVNTGIAGGVGKGLCVGDIVVGSFAVQYDFDMSALGYAPGYMDGEEEDRPTRYMADEKLKKEFLKAAEKVMPAGHIHEGGIATGDRFASDAELGRRLREDFSCLAVEMKAVRSPRLRYKIRYPLCWCAPFPTWPMNRPALLWNSSSSLRQTALLRFLWNF